MRKLIIALLFVCFTIFTFSTSAFASTYFTPEQITEINNTGYPSNYNGHLDTFYQKFTSVAIPILDSKGYTIDPSEYYNNFLDFVRDTCKSYTKSAAIAKMGSDFTFEISRAFYFEVADHSATRRVDGMKGVADCLSNRVKSGLEYSYIDATEALNGLNPAMPSTYWHSIMLNPVPDAAGGNAHDALVAAWAIGYIRCNEIYDLGGTSSTIDYFCRFSSLPWGYNYFNETPGTGRIRIGDFYFRQNY